MHLPIRRKTSHAYGLSRALYLYVWRASRSKQLWICVLTMVLSPLAMVPLELQRRIVDDAITQRNVGLLSVLAAAYLAVICFQGSLKYLLNMVKGAAVETIARDLRLRILKKAHLAGCLLEEMPPALNAGSIVSMLAAETEDVSGFGGEAFAVPPPRRRHRALCRRIPVVGRAGDSSPCRRHLLSSGAHRSDYPAYHQPPGQLRIQLVRNLGHIAVREAERSHSTPRTPGSVLAHRIYTVRIWIYLRKFSLSALGNFLDSVGVIIVLLVGGYLVIQGQTQMGTLVMFISGLAKIADPWDQLVNFYRSISNTAVMYDMIRARLEEDMPFSKRLDGPSLAAAVS